MLLQINTRALLTELSHQLHRPATLDDIPDRSLDDWKENGFEWVWMLSVWQTGPAAQWVSRQNPDWRKDFLKSLPDLREDDIEGSGFAIIDYSLAPSLGGDDALARLRERLARRGIKLMLDFVPNHMGLGHPWLDTHPGYFIQGSEQQLANEPQNYFRHESNGVFAYGRDPYFSGWPDTVQLDYSQLELQDRMIEILQQIATRCDGVRCDMAMLILPDVFQHTWGRNCEPFWNKAIQKVRKESPGFCFLAEVYWDREWDLQQLGFDYCYDKRLYDRLMHETGQTVHAHLIAGLDYQNRLTRFLENHDEQRVNHMMPLAKHLAAAVITYLTPGLGFVQEGQREGKKVKISPHLVRRPTEAIDPLIASFYDRLFAVVRSSLVREGNWLLLDARPAWDGNDTHRDVVCFRWKDIHNRQLIVAVNYCDRPAQARLRVSMDRNCVSQVLFRDAIHQNTMERHRGELFNPGLLLEFEPWGIHVLEEVDA